MATKKELIDKIVKKIDRIDVLEYAETVAIGRRLNQLKIYRENTLQFRKRLESGSLQKNSTLEDLRQVDKFLDERELYYRKGEG
jgi:hypothetical protein